MRDRQRLSTGLASVALASALGGAAHADGVCTPRPPTVAETRVFAAAYDLFVRVAPKAPDGWSSTDNPPNGEMPTLCAEYANDTARRSFGRNYRLERGRAERDAQAMQAYADMAKAQQAEAAANQEAVAAIDAQVNALNVKVQAAVTAQRFADIEPLTKQIDELMTRRSALLGYGELDATSARIQSDQSRDSEASFQLWFEAPKGGTREGRHYPTAAGKAFVTSYEDDGNPHDDVTVYFDGTAQPARVRVSGDPARVRALVDATDLRAVAAFR
jgi:hypothetical protein